MRKAIVIALVSVLLTGGIATTALSKAKATPASKPTPATAPTPSPTDNAVSTFLASRDAKKVDSDTLNTWQQVMKKDPTQELWCFVRVRAPYDQGDRAFLLDHGFVVQNVAGTIARGHLKAQDLPDTASLPFVDSIRLAKDPDQ